MAVAVVTILLDSLLLGTRFSNVSLLLAVVAEAVATSALKKGALDRAAVTWGEWHSVFGGGHHGSVCNVNITQLFQHLDLFHPSLYPFYFHVHCKHCP